MVKYFIKKKTDLIPHFFSKAEATFRRDIEEEYSHQLKDDFYRRLDNELYWAIDESLVCLPHSSWFV